VLNFPAYKFDYLGLADHFGISISNEFFNDGIVDFNKLGNLKLREYFLDIFVKKLMINKLGLSN
jgi:hypothetical protein